MKVFETTKRSLSVLPVGNPLAQEIMSLYQEPDGTRRLLNYLLDNLAGTTKRSECSFLIGWKHDCTDWSVCDLICVSHVGWCSLLTAVPAP